VPDGAETVTLSLSAQAFEQEKETRLQFAITGDLLWLIYSEFHEAHPGKRRDAD
jgi:hypothetical protein